MTPLEAHLVIEDVLDRRSAQSSAVVVAVPKKEIPVLVPATPVKDDPRFCCCFCKTLGWLAVSAILVLLVLVVCVTLETFPFSSDESSLIENSTTDRLTTLEQIRQRGYLRCAYRPFIKHFYTDENGEITGFDAALVRIGACCEEKSNYNRLARVSHFFS